METLEIGRFFLAFVFVLSLMGGLWLVLRKLGLNGPIPIVPAAQRRLKVVESIALDPRRRAIILRRDSTEHLVILGPSGETVVETGISAPHPVDQNEQSR